MANQSPDATTASGTETLLPLNSLQSRIASTFILGGLLLVASVVVPVGLDRITDWSWMAGLVLVGLGVVAIVLGLLGLYPRVHEQAVKHVAAQSRDVAAVSTGSVPSAL